MRHLEQSSFIPIPPEKLFEYVDDHANFSSHMTQSSWMMAGSKMQLKMDANHGQEVGSHIQMGGKVMGMNLFLDEVVTVREPPWRKVWKTVGNPRLLVVGNYEMGFDIKVESGGSKLRVYIDYELPEKGGTRMLGSLFGAFYAKWCVRQMIRGVQEQFEKTKK